MKTYTKIFSRLFAQIWIFILATLVFTYGVLLLTDLKNYKLIVEDKDFNFYYITNDANEIQASITDKKGNTFTAKFQNTFEIYDYTAEFGDLAFECIAGVHKVKFSVNAFSVYGIEKTEFNLSFLVEEDTRADGMEICLSDTSEYTKITSSYFNADSGDYDIYYCKSKPVFKQIIKGVDGYIDESALISFRVLDDNFYSNFPKSLNGLNKGNIYFCQVYCKGTAEYKPANYCCYIIY